MKVKICGLREKANIQEICQVVKPQWIGFIFYPQSVRFAEPFLDADFLSGLHGISKVGVFVDEDLGNVIALANRFQLDTIQLHGNESREICKSIKQLGFQVFKAFSVDSSFDFRTCEAYQTFADHFVFDTKAQLPGGTGLRFDWSILKRYTLETPFLLSGGIGPEQVAAIRDFKHPSFAGVDLNSRFELKPGLKDVSSLFSFAQEINSQQNKEP